MSPFDPSPYPARNSSNTMNRAPTITNNNNSSNPNRHTPTRRVIFPKLYQEPELPVRVVMTERPAENGVTMEDTIAIAAPDCTDIQETAAECPLTPSTVASTATITSTVITPLQHLEMNGSSCSSSSSSDVQATAHQAILLPTCRRSVLSRYYPVPLATPALLVSLSDGVLPPQPFSQQSGNDDGSGSGSSNNEQPLCPKQALVSILKKATGGVTKGSEKTKTTTTTPGSLPLLQSLQASEDGQSSLESAASRTSTTVPLRHNTRSSHRFKTTTTRSNIRRIQFDPRIWIRELERSQEEMDCTWYNDEDMDRFKRHALALILSKAKASTSASSPQIMATGTTRTISSRNNSSSVSTSSTTNTTTKKGKAKGAFFTHAALTLDGEESNTTNTSSSSCDEDVALRQALQTEQYRAIVAQQEIRRILIVDPHDICVTLFRKAFTALLPKVQIVAVTSMEKALEQLSATLPLALPSSCFDIIVVEERLQPLFHSHRHRNQNNNNNINNNVQSGSGSDLFRCLASSRGTTTTTTKTITTNDTGNRRRSSGSSNRHYRSDALWIGVSAHLTQDRAALESAGADLCWGKPPPKLSHELRNQLLQTLLRKRGQWDIVQDLFGDNTDFSRSDAAITNTTTISL